MPCKRTTNSSPDRYMSLSLSEVTLAKKNQVSKKTFFFYTIHSDTEENVIG